MLGHVDHFRVWDLASGCFRFTNVVSSLSWISVRKVVSGKHLTEYDWRSMLLPEQKIVALIKGLVPKFQKPDDLMLNGLGKDAFDSKRGAIAYFLDRHSRLV